ncbi:MAG TPA: Gfo/Idh/MocA family oxidoreductase [Longimicrobiales bacterium]|nr:Gfo/Idh/MocA family oxidoreductase [Longimicrobiales bacterium]
MSGRPLTLALLGCGEAARMHAATLTSVDDAVRLRFASRERERAEAFRAELGGEAAYGSYGEALADPVVDAALVLTPPHRHLELALEGLAADGTVILEKPAFPSTDDFARVREAEQRSGGRVLVAENYHYRPLLGTLRELLAEGAVGEPLLLHVDAVKEQETEGWRDDPEAAGGGALMEGGIHWVHFMAELGLEVQGVEGHRPPPAGRAERTMLVVFRYRGGAVGTLSYSWEVPSPLKGLRLSRVYGRGGALTFESNGLFVFGRGKRLRLRFPGFRDIAGYRAMFRDLLAALREDREPSMTLAMAERDVRLVEAAYEGSTG